jgi:signal transduction histidine kinase
MWLRRSKGTPRIDAGRHDVGQTPPPKVFISYSRRDATIAGVLNDHLARVGVASKLDIKEIVSGETWKRRLDELICDADAIVFIFSPDSVASDHCAWEVARALELKKILIPLLWRKVRDGTIPPSLNAIQYVLFDKYDRRGMGKRSAMSDACNKVVEALSVSDTLWIREHSKWVARAAEWDRSEPRRPNGMLLRGDDIATARAWMRLRPSNAPEAPEVVREYVEASEMQEGADREIEARELKVRAASEAKTAFLSNLSHELRTPLNVIIGMSEMIAKEVHGPSAAKNYVKYAGDIQEAGEHLLSLINDLLDLTVIESGMLKLNPQWIAPDVLLASALTISQGIANRHGVPFFVDVRDVPAIRADARAVTQMILALTSNAIRFTKAGGVLFRARPVLDGLSISIIDTGPGITESLLARLGRPFAKVEEATAAGVYAGAGIGVSIVQRLVRAHGGVLEYDSVVDEGTIATIHLPVGGEGPARADPPIDEIDLVRCGVSLLGAPRETVRAQLVSCLVAKPDADPAPEVASLEAEPPMADILDNIRRIISQDPMTD